MIALSIKNPWAVLVAYGVKDVENRPLNMVKRARSHVGTRILIHAGLRYSPEDHYEAWKVLQSLGETEELPPTEDMLFGHYIGTAVIAGLIEKPGGSKSPWYNGGCGLVFTDAKPIRPIPGRGNQGFYESGIEAVRYARN